MDSKKLALVATLFLAATMTMNNNNSTTEFESFKSTHGKVYSTVEEDTFRLAIFSASKAEVESHNADSTQTYTKAIN